MSTPDSPALAGGGAEHCEVEILPVRVERNVQVIVGGGVDQLVGRGIEPAPGPDAERPLLLWSAKSIEEAGRCDWACEAMAGEIIADVEVDDDEIASEQPDGIRCGVGSSPGSARGS